MQNQNGYSLPKGPLFLSAKTFIGSIFSELSDPAPMKIALIKKITEIFDKKEDIFVGAYGNKDSDVRAYKGAEISESKVYIADPSGDLKRLSDGQKSSYAFHEAAVDILYPKL